MGNTVSETASIGAPMDLTNSDSYSCKSVITCVPAEAWIKLMLEAESYCKDGIGYDFGTSDVVCKESGCCLTARNELLWFDYYD